MCINQIISKPETEKRCEGYRILFGFLITCLISLGVALGVAYCDGRWHLSIGPEMLFAKGIGLFVCFFGCAVLLCIFRKRGKRLTYVAACLSICLVLVVLSKTSSMMIKLYAAGFERAVLCAASVEQWNSVPMIVKKNGMNPSKYQGWMGNLFPDFVWRVYPGMHFACGTVATNDMQIWITWRGWSFDPAMEIGSLKPLSSDFGSRILYEEDYSNSIAVMLLNGGD